MARIAIIGAGAIGGALAHTLATRARVREVRLIDPAGTVAEGKALDVTQAGPIEAFNTRVNGTNALEAAAGANVIVLADSVETGEHSGEAGLSLVRQLGALDAASPIICAGGAQRELIARATGELRMPAHRIVGSAPYALESALRALAGVLIDGSGVEVSLRVVGIPPRAAVVTWEEATANGQPISAELPPHSLLTLSGRIPGLWPPGPYALASAAARIVEALATGSRRRYSCFVAVRPGAVTSMPVELGTRGVARIVEPALTRQERTMMDNAIADRRSLIADR